MVSTETPSNISNAIRGMVIALPLRMNATQTTRIAATLAAIVTAASERAANDNAGMEWRVTDAMPHMCDSRIACEVLTRVAANVVGIVAPTVDADLWRVEVCHRSGGRAAVSVYPNTEWSRATGRRVRAVAGFARALGLDAILN